MNADLTSRLPLIMAVVAGLAIRLYLVYATPIGGPSVPGYLSSYNDEVAHTHYVEFVERTGTLPPNIGSIQGDRALTEGYFENYQPPLYYGIVAQTARLLGLHDREGITVLGRLLNTLLFVAFFPLVIAFGFLLKLERGHVDAAMIFLALNGVTVRFSTTVSNDILFWLLAGGMIWYSMRIWRREATVASVILFSGFAVAALYTKLAALLFLPLPALGLLRQCRPRPCLGLMVSYALIALFTFPIWLRNAGEFGSLLPLNAGFGAPEYSVPPKDTILYAVRSFVFPWSEFWCGWVGLVLMLPVMIVVGMSFIRKVGRQILAREPVMVAALLLAIIGFVWLNVQYRQAEARYVFAAWPVLSIVGMSIAAKPFFQWLSVAALVLPFVLFIFPGSGI